MGNLSWLCVVFHLRVLRRISFTPFDSPACPMHRRIKVLLENAQQSAVAVRDSPRFFGGQVMSLLRYEEKKILIWGKTYPELSIKHLETVCTGGVTEDGAP